MSFMLLQIPSIVWAASEKQKRGTIMSLLKIMSQKCLLNFNLIKNLLKNIASYRSTKFRFKRVIAQPKFHFFQQIIWHRYVDRVGYEALRTFRSEGTIRGSLGFFFVATFNIYLWYEREKQKEEAPIKAENKRIQDQQNHKCAKDTLCYYLLISSKLYNFMIFLAPQNTLNDTFDNIGYKGTMEAAEDYHQGLDGIASEEDFKMPAYYKQSVQYKGHH